MLQMQQWQLQMLQSLSSSQAGRDVQSLIPSQAPQVPVGGALPLDKRGRSQLSTPHPVGLRDACALEACSSAAGGATAH